MENFKVTSSEKTKAAHESLKREIYELKNEIEEVEMMYGKNFRPMSSVSPPLSAEYFRRERELTVGKILQVSLAQPLKNQGEVMMEELEAALKSDVTEKSLPLLLHQFYIDRVQSLIQCKHLHMLRWCRFCEHTDTIERLFPIYRQRLDLIEAEYSDAKARAQRLSAAHHSFVLGDNKAIKSVQIDDVVIFLRWLISHLHSTKKVSSYIKVLHWLPSIHKNSIDLNTAQKSDVEVSGPIAFDAKSSWRNLASESNFSFLSSHSSTRPISTRSNQASVTTSNLAFSGEV
nr:putative uncharacterized protein C6orf183 [Ciona intestinalis]|eukprot:XP_018669782.1 putative uncharacterized protein C6orf183 [Ciona intestinalis]